MCIPAAIAIVCLLLVFFAPGNAYYYQVPMGIIGNVYANSMLLLINSRLQLGSGNKPLMIISTARFRMDRGNRGSTFIDGHNAEFSVYTEATAGTFLEM